MAGHPVEDYTDEVKQLLCHFTAYSTYSPLESSSEGYSKCAQSPCRCTIPKKYCILPCIISNEWVHVGMHQLREQW